jgi:hypothetical protein
LHRTWPGSVPPAAMLHCCCCCRSCCFAAVATAADRVLHRAAARQAGGTVKRGGRNTVEGYKDHYSILPRRQKARPSHPCRPHLPAAAARCMCRHYPAAAAQAAAAAARAAATAAALASAAAYSPLVSRPLSLT